MKKKNDITCPFALIVFLGLWIGHSPPPSICAERSPVVSIVVNQDVPFQYFDRKEIRDIYLGKKSCWQNGKRIFCAVLTEKKSLSLFMKTYLKRSFRQYRYILRGRLFSGKSGLPKFFKSEASLVDYVSRTSGAIGFIPTDYQLPDNAHTLKQMNGYLVCSANRGLDLTHNIKKISLESAGVTSTESLGDAHSDVIFIANQDFPANVLNKETILDIFSAHMENKPTRNPISLGISNNYSLYNRLLARVAGKGSAKYRQYLEMRFRSTGASPVSVFQSVGNLLAHIRANRWAIGCISSKVYDAYFMKDWAQTSAPAGTGNSRKQDV